MAEHVEYVEAIRLAREILNSIPDDHPKRVDYLYELGNHIEDSYSRTGLMDDLEEFIQISRQVLTLSTTAHPRHTNHLNGLVAGLSDRYSRTGSMSDIDEAIQITENIVDSTPKNSPNHEVHLNNLSTLIRMRNSKTGIIDDIDESIQVAREGLATTSSGSPYRAQQLNNLGVFLRHKYEVTNDLACLEESIQIFREIIRITPREQPDCNDYLMNLALQLSDKYSQTETAADIEEAIEISRAAIKATADNQINYARWSINLGLFLSLRFSHLGDLSDIEEAISMARNAVNATEVSRSNYPEYLNNLSTWLGEQYLITGKMADLEEAISISRQAIEIIPEDILSHGGVLNNLGNQLGNKYARTGSISDLEEAIEVTKRAIDIIPQENPNHVLWLANLGNRYADMYLKTDKLSDLEDAIQIAQKVLEKIPEEHPIYAGSLANLGNRLAYKYSKTGNMSILEEALQISRLVLNLTPQNHSDLAERLNRLGNRLGEKALRTRVLGDLEEAISAHKTAIKQINSPVINRIEACHELIRLASDISNWDEIYEASTIMVDLIPRLSPRSLENSDKQYMLSRISGLPSNAAAVALEAGKGPLCALMLLEKGRGVIATSLEDMRTDILDLQEMFPDLANRFTFLRDRLDTPTPQNNPEDTSGIWKAQMDQRSQAGKEMDALIAKIREQPGFDDFLASSSEDDIRGAARYGPIVVINTTEYRCDAILIEQHQIRSLYLPNLNGIEIEARTQAGSLGNIQTLEWLWDTITNPILTALEFTQPPSNDNWPHIWWIPTGSLSKFPLHAAGYHRRQGSFDTVCDRAMSSYSSSIKTIVHGRRRPRTLSTRNRALLAAVEDAPGYSQLLFAKEEIQILRNLCPSMTLYPLDTAQTKNDILSQLLECQVFHFAGHGHTDIKDPSKSYLLLKDGTRNPLTIADLLTINIRQQSPFLAYLSACGTGQIKEDKFIDESIHLISAFQLAGFRHVIGTLWEVDDRLCVDVARIVYEEMRDGGMEDISVCRGLHRATREMRHHWINSQATTSLQGLLRIEELSLSEGVGKGRDASFDDSDVGGLERNIELCDGDEEASQLQWVPYVHFGI